MNKTIKKIFFYLSIVLLFVFFAIVNTYPLITKINTHQLGDGGDGGEFLWNLWWTKTSLTKLHQSPYTTDYIFYPYGTSLYLHSLTPLNGIISIPLQYIFDNLILVYNIVALLNFVLAGLAMFLLAFYFTKNKLASFIGGYVFAFSPFMLAHAFGHLHLITTWPIPLFILFFIKFHHKKTFKNVILSSLFFVIATFGSLYNALFIIISILLFECFYIIKYNFKINRKFVLKLSLIFIISFLILSPLFLGVLQSVQSKDYLASPHYLLSADIATFIVPGNLLNFSKLFDHFNWWQEVQKNSSAGAENQNFLGYTVLIICFIGIYFFKKRQNSTKKYLDYWISLVLIGILLSVGTELKFFGRIFNNIHLPYYFVCKYLPSLSFSNGRYPLLAFIALSVLVALGLNEIFKRLDGGKKYLIFIIVFVLIVAEFLMVPFAITKYNIPKFYNKLKNEKENFAIYYIPNYISSDIIRYKLINKYIISSTKYMYYQTIHHKKITRGVTSKLNLNSIKKIDKISVSDFKKYNIKYVVCKGGIGNCRSVIKYPMVYKEDKTFVFKVY